MSAKAVVWSGVIAVVLAFTIFQWGQCAHENELESAYNDAEVIKQYVDGLVDAAEGSEIGFERLSIYHGLQWAAMERYYDAAIELADFRRSRWWNQGHPPGELDRRY